MVEHTRDDDSMESFDLTVRCPGVAFDVGQKGFARVLVVQRLADTVTEYDAARGDGEKGQLEYFKNAMVGATEDDTVYQCVYLPDSPVGRGELNDPKTRYPVPESRLIPFRAEKADPVDNSGKETPREAVQRDTMESLFDAARTFTDAPSMDTIELLARHTGINDDVVQSAREVVEARSYENVPDDLTLDKHVDLELDDRLSMDDDGMDAELTEAEAVEELGGGGASTDVQDPATDPLHTADGDPDDPPEPPEDGGPDSVGELEDEELGDFDPDDL